MDMPKNIKQGVIAVWITIAVTAVVYAIDKRFGEISNDRFAAYLVLSGLCCIFPYKLSKGSNPTRYIFTILTAMSYLGLIGGFPENLPILDIVFEILLLPVYIFAIYRLFTGEANAWFTDKRPPALPNAK